MANIIGGVKVSGFISPSDSNDTYPVTDTIYGIDGLRNYSGDSTVLSGITTDRRRAGMIVGVSNGSAYYKLNPAPWSNTITDWTLLNLTGSTSGSGGSSTDLYWSAGTNTGAIKTLSGGTVSSGQYSFAVGFSTSGTGNYSFAQGYQTKATGDYSHAEGFQTQATGIVSHTEGTSTLASGFYSHAEGNQTKATGQTAHAEGYQSIAGGQSAHAEGYQTIALGFASHAEGSGSTASGDYSHAEGGSTALGVNSHAEGFGTIAQGDTSHAEGGLTIAGAVYSHAEGYLSIASGQYSHAQGYQTSATTLYSHSQGIQTLASGIYSHAEGNVTKASNSGAHAEGSNTIASGLQSHAEGFNTTASGDWSHSEGNGTIASGTSSHAGGFNSQANGSYSFVHGSGSTANNTHTVVLGANISGLSANTTYVDGLNIKTVGAGPSTINIGVDGTGKVVNQASDLRLKENITPLTDSLEKVTKLQGVKYQWIDKIAGGDEFKIGFIAQEVELVEPLLVYIDKISEEQYKGVNYSEITALLVEAIKELTNKTKVYGPYNTDDEADNDINLPSGSLYKLNGSRAIYQKP